MKNLKFVLGLALGIILSLTIFYIASCKSQPIEEAKTDTKPSSKFLKEVESGVRAYKLDVDNIQYIVVVNHIDGGVAITKHE